ncbi:FAS1-like dehydratase domain-containing protein [Aestuariivita boseongensis]|uniref:FAS1-like dehydratase domain-containing protein n=1 Tax=Aestuariivita boseongensis TaxID=1470562 RepID=UPI000B08C737|nr:MaoC family dehydratase N-terminal domain-containing protein [Aestuariivita boseongensis]
MDQINLTAWENRTEHRTGGLSVPQAQMAQATLGTSHLTGAGEVMPALWHWFAFLPDTPTEALGEDGHQPLGDFMPPVPLKRRMWAGGSLTFLKPLHIGEELTRHTTIRSVAEKDGASGPMVFVTLDHEVSGQDGLAIRERQDIVYLPIPSRYAPPRKQDAPEGPDFAEPVATTATLLFRYSALTFNAHRIHYDLSYAQQVEHYPGLVVHGPLQATLLIDAATRHRGRAPDRFSFRGVHPVLAGEATQIMGQQNGAEMTLCTAVTGDAGPYQGMQAKAIWEDEQ